MGGVLGDVSTDIRRCDRMREGENSFFFGKAENMIGKSEQGDCTMIPF